MKKLSLIFFLLLALTVFSAQKSGIAKYDNLQYAKGKTVVYFDAEGNSVTKANAEYERKVYSQGRNLYIVVDYFADTKEPAYIFETTESHIKEFEPSGDDTLNGLVIYYGNGNIATIGVFEGSNVNNGTITTYDEDGTKLETITFKDGAEVSQ